MAWTEMQTQAIHKRGQNILVSAGAGSGKTAVLSERILEYCLDGKDICSFLVLTFTNAAASEMKERIRKKLIDHKLYEQASKIDSAFITTFDAYSLALVKKYYFHLNIDKEITIMDQALLEVQKKKIIDDIFMEGYENKDSEFFSVLEKYTKQNDESVKKIILSLFHKLELIVDEEAFVRAYEETYYTKDFILNLVKEYETLCLRQISNLKDELIKLMDLTSIDEASSKLSDSLVNIVNKEGISSYDEAVPWLNALVLPRSNPKCSEAVKTQKTYCADLIKEIKTKYFSKYVFLKEAEAELYAIQKDVMFLLKLAVEVKHRLDAYKSELMAFDYMDIAKMAIRLVQTNASVRNEIKNGFTEILIDEYQDTSDIQETFISYIANQNCYMVGDIKQSIYRFRNANPYIFKEKYTAYTNHEGGIKIDLTYNFRSCGQVVEDINLIFSNLMTLEIGDANYAYEHLMRYGQKEYEKSPKPDLSHMQIYTYDGQEEFKDEEVEAFLCGRKIQELIKNPPMILKGNQFKPLELNDIAILIDKTKSFITFKRVFEYLNLPLSIEADLDLNDSILPKLFANIFTCILHILDGTYDKEYEHALASIARSFLFEYEDETIYLMLKKRQETELQTILQKLADEVSQYALEELYFKILEVFPMYEKLSIIGDVNNSCVALEHIHSLFAMMASSGMELHEACEYFKSIFENGIALKYRYTEESKNCVHLMTIHKSKGLEFPYCFFPMLGSKFNQSDLKENFGLSEKYGVYIPYSDETNSNTIIKSLVEEDIRKADLSEKIRLFYVALTRARQKIILISKNIDKEDLIPVDRIHSFNDLLHTKLFFKEYETPVEVSSLGISLEYRAMHHPLTELAGKKIEYRNDTYLSEYQTPSVISKELTELTDSALKRSIELGKKFHACLEVLDFNHLQIENLPVDDFMKNVLKKVFSTSVLQNVAEAKTYHEHEFYYNQYHGIIDLLCVYEDHIDIIDYKLSGTSSEEYLRQLGIYKQYVEHHSALPVSCYLLSILKQEIKKVL
ncbi:UvrD-helicase domain-containing protein [bacterium]|nr:UvrD-helicase domain-containing protein [bacterium]